MKLVSLIVLLLAASVALVAADKPAAPTLNDTQKFKVRDLMLTDSNFVIQLYQIQFQITQLQQQATDIQQKKQKNAEALMGILPDMCPTKGSTKFQLNVSTLECSEVPPASPVPATK